MKRLFSLLSLPILASMALSAAGPVFHSAEDFDLIGRGIPFSDSYSHYQRIPDSLQSIVPRWQLWDLGRNPSGQAIRFSTDSPSIDLKWRSTSKVEMNHMTPTGVRGLDLYCLMPDSTWRFVNSARPALDSVFTQTNVISSMKPGVMREFMLYLPLYDGIADLEIGVAEGSRLEKAKVALPQTGNPIVAYGTSILQGGCASRPGMSHSNIIARRLNREFINFGFSGNGQLDLEIAPVVASVKNPAIIILDFVPNVNKELIEEKMIPFFDIIRAAHPDVPILFVENPRFPHAEFDCDIADKIASRNVTLMAKYNELIERGEKNIYFLSSEDMLGHDGEATVDGIHFTDLGFMRYADLLTPVISRIISNN